MAKKKQKSDKVSTNKNDMDRLQSALEGSATPMIHIDRDFTITYVNPATVKMVTKYIDTFKKAFQGFSVESVVGSCIDDFHKDPSYQRGILDNPNNLPYQADITVGDLTFSLNVSAMIDSSGNYLGNSLEWQDVTNLRAKETQSARLESAAEGSGTAQIQIDRDLVVTYANPATVAMVTKHLDTFKKLFPGFAVDKVVGSCIDDFHKDPSYQRGILNNPKNLPYQAMIEVGELKFELNVSGMFDKESNYIGANLEWNDVTEAKLKETEAARLNSMVEGTDAPFMVVDKDLVITYVNPAAVVTMGKYQEEIRKAFPGFDINNLLGVCIDEFHVNPAHQRGVLGNPKNLPVSSELKIGPLEFGVTAMALSDAQGEHIGSAVMWTDLNERAKYSNEIKELYESGKSGDLQKRGNVAKMDDVYRPMLSSVNEIIDTIVAPISELQESLAKVSDGDLTAYVSGEYEGDHAKLKNALNGTLDSLNDVMGQALGASNYVQSGSSQVSQSAQSLSQASSEAASSLEEITASMTEMSSQTKQNAENASQANQLAIEAKTNAEGGNEQMQEMVKAMSDIDLSAQSISKIIKVIDEIAFQTNLLALNAAVEAARAGVHGKGFAVVAEEVRNLAARSAKAAKETTDLIEDSIKKVNQGTEIANKTAGALEEIVSGVGKVTDLVGEIAAASNEQAQGINQVNSGLDQLDKVTQQNTAGSEQSAAASEELAAQAEELSKALNQFTIKKGDDGAQELGGISPEMMEAFKAFMQMQQMPEGKAPAAKEVVDNSSWGKADTSASKPEDIISFGDEHDFGKY